SDVSWPAAYPEVVSVAASDQRGRRADFSSTNPDVEVTAPGVGILSLKASGGYVRMSGTSMAAPVISGAAALLWAILKSPSLGTVRAALDRSTHDAGPRGRDSSYGFGLFDFALTGTSG
ncbi:MAG: S8 family serine peptidase, partial [Actinomycetes bacterium]